MEHSFLLILSLLEKGKLITESRELTRRDYSNGMEFMVVIQYHFGV
jgi:hypothetical protein